MDGKATRMVLWTAALTAFALLVAAPVSAYVPEGDGVHAVGVQSEFGVRGPQVDARHQTLVQSGGTTSQAVGLDPAIQTAIEARLGELGLTGDSPSTRVSAPEPEGLTGDSAATRYVTPQTPTASDGGGRDIDWTSFGAGAGMAALLAAGFAGILLATRRRHTVGMS